MICLQWACLSLLSIFHFSLFQSQSYHQALLYLAHTCLLFAGATPGPKHTQPKPRRKLRPRTAFILLPLNFCVKCRNCAPTPNTEVAHSYSTRQDRGSVPITRT